MTDARARRVVALALAAAAVALPARFALAEAPECPAPGLCGTVAPAFALVALALAGVGVAAVLARRPLLAMSAGAPLLIAGVPLGPSVGLVGMGAGALLVAAGLVVPRERIEPPMRRVEVEPARR